VARRHQELVPEPVCCSRRGAQECAGTGVKSPRSPRCAWSPPTASRSLRPRPPDPEALVEEGDAEPSRGGADTHQPENTKTGMEGSRVSYCLPSSLASFTNNGLEASKCSPTAVYPNPDPFFIGGFGRSMGRLRKTSRLRRRGPVEHSDPEPRRRITSATRCNLPAGVASGSL
jgi:hypothetical protein